ncbi:MAG: class I SAM-dependent methyltransferase, partial [Burkholderiales bacterium]
RFPRRSLMVGVAVSFGGSIPEYYDSIMGAAQFEAFGADLVRRVPAEPPGDVLEIACGSGRVTRQLRERLHPSVRLVASDLSQAMLDYAKRKVRGDIEWREADACRLPFAEGAFAAAVCAFGIMFVPDKAAALREARRVLVEGGSLLFNVWDGLQNNPHGRIAATVLEGRFPDDPVMKFGSMPYMFNDLAQIRRLLDQARFREVRAEPVRIACTCPSAQDFATGQLRGTPRGSLLAERGVSIDELIEKIAAALAEMGGAAPFKYTAQALVVEARAI